MTSLKNILNIGKEVFTKGPVNIDGDLICFTVGVDKFTMTIRNNRIFTEAFVDGKRYDAGSACIEESSNISRYIQYKIEDGLDVIAAKRKTMDKLLKVI